MTHYDTLGVGRDASPDAIKKAYRKRASKAHPDKGGTAEEMAKVNRALEVLSDPQRRDDYDRTGSDGQTMTVAQEAEDLLMGAMTSVLDVPQGKFIKAVADTLAGMGAKLDAAMSNNAGTRKRLQKRRDAIDCTSERNLAAMIIDQKIAEIDRAEATHKRMGEVLAAARELFKAYTSKEEVVPPTLGDFIHERGASGGVRFFNLRS